MLHFDFIHSKVVKSGIVKGVIQGALLRSCPHQMLASLCDQADRLAQGGYPREVLDGVAENLFNGLRHPKSSQPRAKPNVRPLVFPYIFKITHRLKRVAQ